MRRAPVLLAVPSVACNSSGGPGAADAFDAPPETTEPGTPAVTPAVDEPYIQEFNRTFIPGSDPLVAVVAPPSGWEATFGTPIRVTAPDPYEKHGSMRSDGHILPYDERRCDRWNTSQFMVDGGMSATIEMDGADVLAPYWMARYHGWIVPAE
ncbi:MAG: hypothetical protein FJ087_20015 [Deltaproteobacteria bacterium]|nr:hypothetical protein [Deltaproteobacteria bacterium]